VKIHSARKEQRIKKKKKTFQKKNLREKKGSRVFGSTSVFKVRGERKKKKRKRKGDAVFRKKTVSRVAKKKIVITGERKGPGWGVNHWVRRRGGGRDCIKKGFSTDTDRPTFKLFWSERKTDRGKEHNHTVQASVMS